MCCTTLPFARLSVLKGSAADLCLFLCSKGALHRSSGNRSPPRQPNSESSGGESSSDSTGESSSDLSGESVGESGGESIGQSSSESSGESQEFCKYN